MRLINIENIDYVKLEDSLHCLEHHKGDEVECVICAPTVEAIPKADYENRLKADFKAILVELQLEIEEIEVAKENTEIRAGECCMKGACIDLIQQKISALRGEKNE